MNQLLAAQRKDTALSLWENGPTNNKDTNGLADAEYICLMDVTRDAC